MPGGPAHRFPYRWRLANGYPARGVEPNGLRVFGTFLCAGGSTMGYKLAGYTHLGGVEIDPKAAKIYAENHKPAHLFVEDIRAFNARASVPDDLVGIDILDGSPPCTTFSLSGDRERTWGKEKVFREGQAKQTLDDLGFAFCDTVEKLRPKAVVMENVKGLALGNARAYLAVILSRLRGAGYRPQCFLLNAARMGVPQTRERCFVLALRNDLAKAAPPIRLSFDEPPIRFGEIRDRADNAQNLVPECLRIWRNRRRGDTSFSDVLKRERGKASRFNALFVCDERVAPTIPSTGAEYCWAVPRALNQTERLLLATFPLDFNTFGNSVKFYAGMSVPPVMMAQVALQIKEQWLQRKESNARRTQDDEDRGTPHRER